MLVEISNPNIINNNLQKLFLKRTQPSSTSKKQVEQTRHVLSTKKFESNSNIEQFNYLPKSITSQLVVNKLAKQSQKAFRFTAGKNKQAEKHLGAELNLIEKDYAYDDSNWLRDYTNIKKSVKDVQLCSPCYDEEASKSLYFDRPKTSYSLKSAYFNGSAYYTKTASTKTSTKTGSAISKESNILNNLNSYTSMVGFKNDRSREQLDNFCFKKILNSRAITASSDARDLKSVNYQNLTNDDDDDGDEIFDEFDEKNKNELKSNNIDHILEENKSVRRPLKSRASAKDIINKMKSLENKCNYCREQTLINFKLDDRNVRYGNPPPRNKAFRQLKIISQLESIIK